MLERQALDQSQQADAARRAEERAAMRAKNLESELAGVKAVIETANAEVERLTKEIDTIRRAHENEKAHMHNDYDELRGRVLRCLRVELSLLDEGLQALKRTPPKVHVMIDHADRAIEGLKREMERIRGEG
jgi:prefoldin subunit 5